MKRQSSIKIVLMLLALAVTSLTLAQKSSLVRIHENVRVTPYPQEEHALYINPSPLLVPANMRTAEYLQFELSQNRQFPKNKTISSKPLPWCMFNPHKILANGTGVSVP